MAAKWEVAGGDATSSMARISKAGTVGYGKHQVQQVEEINEHFWQRWDKQTEKFRCRTASANALCHRHTRDMDHIHALSGYVV